MARRWLGRMAAVAALALAPHAAAGDKSVCGMDSPSGTEADDRRIDLVCEVTSSAIHVTVTGPGVNAFETVDVQVYTRHGEGFERTQVKTIYSASDHASFINSDAGFAAIDDWKLLGVVTTWKEDPKEAAAKEAEEKEAEEQAKKGDEVEVAPGTTYGGGGGGGGMTPEQQLEWQKQQYDQEVRDWAADQVDQSQQRVDQAMATVDAASDAMKDLVNEIDWTEVNAEAAVGGTALGLGAGMMALWVYGVGAGLATSDYEVPVMLLSGLNAGVGVAGVFMGPLAHGGPSYISGPGDVLIGPGGGMPPKITYRMGSAYTAGRIAADRWAYPYEGEATPVPGFSTAGTLGVRVLRASMTGTLFSAAPDSPTRELKATNGLDLSCGAGLQYGFGLLSPWVERRIAMTTYFPVKEGARLTPRVDDQGLESHWAVGNTFEFSAMRNGYAKPDEQKGIVGMFVDVGVAFREVHGTTVTLQLGATLGPLL